MEDASEGEGVDGVVVHQAEHVFVVEAQLAAEEGVDGCRGKQGMLRVSSIFTVETKVKALHDLWRLFHG